MQASRKAKAASDDEEEDSSKDNDSNDDDEVDQPIGVLLALVHSRWRAGKLQLGQRRQR